MLLKFVDRGEELHTLDEKFHSPNAEFVIVYGRRRIGKTELIKKFAHDKKHFYFLSRKEPLALEVNRFRTKFSKKFNIYIEETDDFEVLFRRIVEKIDISEKFVFLIDEFPYLIESYKPVVSVFQSVWDEVLKDKNVFLILTGSSVSMMETEVLGYKSPLYGRRTGQLNLMEIPLSFLPKFLPGYDAVDLIQSYGALGGISFYLKEFDSKNGFFQNVENTFFNKHNILFQEAEILLKEELREPNTYFNILKAMIDGATKLSEISTKSLVDITNVNKYISVLQTLKLVRKIYPVMMPEKKRNFLYKVTDNYFRFWLSYVYPYKEEIEENPMGVTDFIKKQYQEYMGSIFEDVVRQMLHVTDNWHFSTVGSWWYKENEIDIVAINERSKKILFGECKWQNKEMNKGVYEKLLEKKELVKWNNDKWEENIALFSKSGFSHSLKKVAESENIMLYTLDDIKKILWG
ncbi:ATPase [Thermoplasmatales archaeon ex4572_165]|nr:MAG: ATPase [Thermoplasmatales archaeon ex4572_165]